LSAALLGRSLLAAALLAAGSGLPAAGLTATSAWCLRKLNTVFALHLCRGGRCKPKRRRRCKRNRE
jgi:hypothetical protein